MFLTYLSTIIWTYPLPISRLPVLPSWAPPCGFLQWKQKLTRHVGCSLWSWYSSVINGRGEVAETTALCAFCYQVNMNGVFPDGTYLQEFGQDSHDRKLFGLKFDAFRNFAFFYFPASYEILHKSFPMISVDGTAVPQLLHFTEVWVSLIYKNGSVHSRLQKESRMQGGFKSPRREKSSVE